MVLWLQWEHRGRLSSSLSSQTSELIGLDAQKFHGICDKTLSFKCCQHYAKAYAREIMRDSSDATDIWGSPMQAFDMVIEHFGVDLAFFGDRAGDLGKMDKVRGAFLSFQSQFSL